MSSTMIAANTTGIPVFVTGGIGGVHRGAQSSESLHLLTVSSLINIGIVFTKLKVANNQNKFILTH